MKAVLVNYNYTPVWLKHNDLDYVVYDRSDMAAYTSFLPPERIIKTPNIGNVDLDKLSYLVNNYDSLPEVFLWGKANLFKYVDKQLLTAAIFKKEFAPLLKFSHKIYSDLYGPVNYYKQGMYYERNNSWYLGQQPAKHFQHWEEWALQFHLPIEPYIPFPPGGNFILTKERVHRYPKELYEQLRSYLMYTELPGEAQLCERSYWYLWR